MLLQIDIKVQVCPNLTTNEFYNSLFLSILTAFPPVTKHAILYDACNVKLQLYAKGLAWSMEGGGG